MRRTLLLAAFLPSLVLSQDLTVRFADAIKAKDEAALAAIGTADPKTTFPYNYKPGWNRNGWTLVEMKLPDGRRYLILNKTHPCESDGDHMHQVVGDKLGPELSETNTFGYRIRHHTIEVQFDLPKHTGMFKDTVSMERVDPKATDCFFRVSTDYRVSKAQIGGKDVPYVQAGTIVWIPKPATDKFDLYLEYGGESYHPGQFVSNTVSEPEVTLAAYWYPVIGRLPSTMDCTITVPRGWTAITCGNMLSRMDDKDTSRFAFNMAVPICYYTLDAGPYYIYSKRVGDRMYNVYTLVPKAEAAQRQLDYFDGSFQQFSKWFGPYPWNQYTVVETQQRGWGGALEAYSFTTYGPGLVGWQSPHEWAHTWFGGIISGTYLQGIFTESFAVFASTLFDRRPTDSSPAILDALRYPRVGPRMQSAWNQVSLWDSSDALNGISASVGYGKGDNVLSYLDFLIGRDAMLQACKNFRYDLKPGEAATWADFEAAVKKATKKDYKWFFDEWVRRPGLPKISLDAVKLEGNRVTGAILQTQPFYRLPVELMILGADGKYVTTTVNLNGERTPISSQTNLKPIAVIIDPGMRIPREVTQDDKPLAIGNLRTLYQHAETIMVVPPAMVEDAKKLVEGSDTVVKTPSEVTELDTETKNLVVVGDVLDSEKSYKSINGGIKLGSKQYIGPDIFAATVRPNPDNPKLFILNMTALRDRIPSQPWARTVVYKGNDLVDGELAYLWGGISVWKP